MFTALPTVSICLCRNQSEVSLFSQMHCNLYIHDLAIVTKQDRLNHGHHLTVLPVHQDRLDAVTLNIFKVDYFLQQMNIDVQCLGTSNFYYDLWCTSWNINIYAKITIALGREFRFSTPSTDHWSELQCFHLMVSFVMLLMQLKFWICCKWPRHASCWVLYGWLHNSIVMHGPAACQ